VHVNFPCLETFRWSGTAAAYEDGGLLWRYEFFHFTS